MGKRKTKRLPFKVAGSFVARRYFVFNGINFEPGQDFHELTSDRRLRQLFDMRKIDMKEAEKVKKPKKEKPTIEPKGKWEGLTEPEILDLAYDRTGIRFRKLERAIKALDDV